jgi:hypothetical protein
LDELMEAPIQIAAAKEIRTEPGWWERKLAPQPCYLPSGILPQILPE